MKIDRQMGILTILLQKGKVTAPELALRFEVSRRTIQRDIEDLCMAGIPIVTTQGGDGGIRIADGFSLDRSLLKPDELQNVLIGLRSLGSVSDTARIEELVLKLSPKDAPLQITDSIVIDLSSHYKNSLSEKITLFKTAISKNLRVTFDYYSPGGRTSRVVEPYLITFKWSAWYVLCFCCISQEFRLFKLNRLWKAHLTDESFTPRTIPDDKKDLDEIFKDDAQITLLFDKSAEYLVIEAYGPESYEIQEDGKLKATISYTNRDYILSWVLGFGDKVKVLSPSDMVQAHQDIAKKIINRYEHDNQLSGSIC